jgi:predicted DNA-binding protein
MKNAMKNFHVPLPEVLYDRLRELASRRGRPATSLVREAIEQWVVRTERMRISEEIAAYAAAEAGGRNDLDPDLEQAAAEEFFRPEAGK